jgi:integral membrane protein (TIGR00529 family)
VYETSVVALSFVLVVVLLRLRWKVGRALLVSVVLLAAVLPMRPWQFWGFLTANWAAQPWHRSFPVQTADLLLLVVLVNFLGAVLEEYGLSARLPAALRRLLRSRRLALAGVPAMMGLMPTPGGIMLSAPIVRDAAADYGMPPARAATVNYWFRHVWEYSFPLFPALPLTAGILGAEVGNVIAATCYISLLSLLVGGFILLRGFPAREAGPAADAPGMVASLRGVAAAVWPVGMALALCTAVRMPPGVALAAALLLLVGLYRPSPGRAWQMLRKSFEIDLLLVVVSAMGYRAVLEASGAVGTISQFISGFGLPVVVLVFLLPFFVGVITGISSAMVGLSFPLLLEFLAPGGHIRYEMVALAYCGGMSGVYVTPVHLCFALSKDYFKVGFGELYRYVVPLTAAVAALVFAVALAWGRLVPRAEPPGRPQVASEEEIPACQTCPTSSSASSGRRGAEPATPGSIARR